jgi:hypothetical protein
MEYKDGPKDCIDGTLPNANAGCSTSLRSRETILLSVKKAMPQTHRLGQSASCRLFLLFLFLQTLNHAYSSPTDHIALWPAQELVQQPDDFIKAIDRHQAKRSEDKVGQADIESIATCNSISEESLAGVLPARGTESHITPVSSYLIYTQITASSL